MFNYIWPVVLVVISNIIYQLCAKSVPDAIHPMASLTITYAVAAVVSLVLFFTMTRGGNLISEYSKLNWSAWALGLSIVGLEVGMIYGYRAGWSISTLPVVTYVLMSIGLIIIGYFFYREGITWNKLLGIAACIGGVVLLNIK